MTIAAWLKSATTMLADNAFETPRLDAEIILAHTISHSRSWLHAHGDEALDLRKQEIADARIDLRLDNVPVAYIIGHKEFYGRRFNVSPSVLIPRPESEQIIELLSGILPSTQALPGTTNRRLVDIGTGSGCLGITAKLEHPDLSVTLTDIDRSALTVAEKNASTLQADVEVMQSDLFSNYPFSPDIVLANLPYVSRDWERSKSTDHEPQIALFAEDSGLSLIKKFFDQLSLQTSFGATAIIEADPRQWNTIDVYAKQAGFSKTASREFAHMFQKD